MERPGPDRGISRREFAKAAVAIGGSAALAACLDRNANPDVPTGSADASHPARQHAWNAVLDADEHGNALLPRHHVLLLLEYRGDGTPSDDERRTVERALGGLERAYERSNRGLLFTVGYSRAYFDRFEESLPEGVDLPAPKALAPFEDPEPETCDAVAHLASDAETAVLGAEEALLGRADSANGVEMEASVEDVFEVAARRSGFTGAGMPAERRDVSGVPDDAPVSEEAPLYMGFKSGFEKNQATEERVTIGAGPFAGGATEHVSKIALHLDQWYEQDGRYERVAKMFCPAHADSGAVEGAGDNLGNDSGMDACPAASESARTHGVVGHSQKMVSAREDDRPLLLRRDFDSTDDGRAGLHFVSLQRRIEEFVGTREAMNGTDLSEGSAVGRRNNNGVLQYMTVERRGNFLLPPRSLRALPPARPEA